MERKDILTHATMWMDLEDVRSVKSASLKGQGLCDSTSVRSLEDRDQETGQRGGGGVVYGVSFWDGEKVLGVDGGDGYATLNATKLYADKWLK